MADYRYVVFTDCEPGREDEFNAWYDEVHLAEVCSVPGVAGAVRFEAVAGADNEVTHRYLAIYDLEGDGNEVVAEIRRHAAAGKFRMSSALNRDTTKAMLYRRRVPGEG